MKFASVIAVLCGTATALIPLQIKANRFIKPSIDAKEPGEVFFLKGVDYQPGGSSGYSADSTSDVLSDADACYRDAYVLQELGANTIRVYTIDPDINHDKCMSILNDAGIYVILDVNSPLGGESLNRDDPDSSYNAYYLSRVFKVIEAFKNYPNVIGFFSGNEVINDGTSAKSDPVYIRAVQRDMKQYIAKHANRTIPVGYSAADNLEYRGATWAYLQCHIDGEDDDESASDFFGLNSYEWCSGSSTWSSSGYGEVNSTFESSTIPVFFSEYGCNKNSPRTFDEVSEGVYGGLVNTLSGGLVYEYSGESNNYGLTEVDEDSGEIVFNDDFDNLKSQFDKASIPTISEDDVTDRDVVNCTKKLITDFTSAFETSWELPDQSDDIVWLIKHGVNATNVGELVDVSEKYGGFEIENASGVQVATDEAIATFSGYNTWNSQTGATTATATKSSSSTSASGATSTSAKSSSSKGDAPNENRQTTGTFYAFALLVAYLA